MPKTTLKVPLIGTPKVRPRPTRCRANGADCSNLTHPLFLPLFLGRMRESQHAASNGDWRNMVSILNGRVTRVIFIFLASEIHTFSNVTNGHRHRLDIAIPSDPPPPLLERTRLGTRLRLGCHPARSHTRRRGATSHSRCTVTRSIHEAARRRAGRRGVLFCVMVFLCE